MAIPARITEEELNENGETTHRSRRRPKQEPEEPPGPEADHRAADDEHRKFYFDGGQVEIAAHLVYELDPNGKQLRVVRYTDYAAESRPHAMPDRAGIRGRNGPIPTSDREIIRRWLSAVSASTTLPRPHEPAGRRSVRPAVPPRLQCPAAHPARACAAAPRGPQGLLRALRPEARQILEDLLEKYAEHGDAQFVLPDVLRVPPISTHGQVSEIVAPVRRGRSAPRRP